MIGKITYQDMITYVEGLNTSSDNLKNILNNYTEDGKDRVLEFCDLIDSYARYLSSTLDLYQASDEALQTMIDKNK